MRVEPSALDQLLHPMIDPKAERKIVASGLPASPGAACGEIVFNSDDAEAAKKAGRKVILVRVETSPEDIHGMHAAEGILTTRGGMTSHAAVVARGMGKPCVSGAGSIRVDYAAQTLTVAGQTLQEGRRDHRRWRHRPGAARAGEDARAGIVGRIRDAHGLGRQGAAHEGARQCRDAARCRDGAQFRRRRHRPLPHRAHVLRRRPHRCGSRDDPLRRRERAPRRAGEIAADAAQGFRRAVQDHARLAGDDPPARSASARIPAAFGSGDGGSRAGDERVGRTS